jgi:hypothetical protein
MALTVTDGAGNVSTHVRRFDVIAADVPSQARIGRAFAGDPGGVATAIATWSAPLTANGSRITGYRVKALKLRANGTVAGQRVSSVLRPNARSFVMRLAAGRYRFQVQAINAIGTSKWSARSNAVRSR